MKKMLRFILLLVVVLGIAAAAGMWKVRQLADSKLLIKEETIFTLEPGTGRLALGQDLYREKVINRPRVFQWLLRVEPELSHFKAGTYRFTPQMTVREMLQLLASGKEAQFPLRFVEGMRVSDYLRQLRDAPYVKHTLEDDSYATVAKALGLEHADWVEGWFLAGYLDVHRQYQRYRHPQARASENGRRSGEDLGRTDGQSALCRSEPAVDHGLDY